jgi:hypothetical protein
VLCDLTAFVFVVQLNNRQSGGQSADLIIHRDVKEGRKRGGQLTLGTPLRIQTSNSSTMRKEEVFEDLDEIVARFVEPMVEKFQEVVKHRQAILYRSRHCIENAST